MSFENWKILKTEIDEKQEEYSQVAQWCNENQEYHIELYIDENDIEWYRTVKNPEPTEEEIKERRIANLKQLLADTDYVVIKIAEGSATVEQYADIIAKRQEWRAEINKLENSIENILS